MAMILAASEQNIFVHVGFRQWQLKIWQSIHAAPSHQECLAFEGLCSQTWKTRGRQDLSSEFRFFPGLSSNSTTKDSIFEGDKNTKFECFSSGGNSSTAPCLRSS